MAAGMSGHEIFYLAWGPLGSLLQRPGRCNLPCQQVDYVHPAQVEFGLPDLESRAQIFQIHTRTMNCERDIRFELLARCAALLLLLLPVLPAALVPDLAPS